MNISKDYVKIGRVNTRVATLPLIAAACVVFVSCSTEKKAEAPPTRGSAALRQSYNGPLSPLPPPQYELSRPIEVVQAVYEFAGRRPDVLQYVPCFCGCQASGHVGNDDCFVSARDASGKPTWDLHGMG
jgi:Protein of unknown function with PCYCGC motif